MKRGNTDCRCFQKRRDWIRQRLRFTVKIMSFARNYYRFFHIRNFNIDHNTSCLSPKILHIKLCFQFLLRFTILPREELKTMLMQNFGGKQGVLWSMWKLRMWKNRSARQEVDPYFGPGSWTGSMDPLSWTGSMDGFFFNNEKWTKTEIVQNFRLNNNNKQCSIDQ